MVRLFLSKNKIHVLLTYVCFLVAMKKVLQRKHKIDGIELDVKPCINTDVQAIPNQGVLSVQIYVGNITKVNVDCIVNSTNEQLMRGGGVAAAISEAAGYALDQESKDFVARNGPLPVGKCCATTAGNLPYKFVIHAVGPRWHDYSSEDKPYCLEDLQEAVEVSFKEADKLEMKSVALPAISSGDTLFYLIYFNHKKIIYNHTRLLQARGALRKHTKLSYEFCLVYVCLRTKLNVDKFNQI